MNIEVIKKELKKYSSREKAKVLQSFFKTGPGQYGEEDIFIGVKVPDVRNLARKYQNLGKPGILKFLQSPIHEERLLSLLIMIFQFQKGTLKEKKAIYETYLKQTRHINNWDLVDLSAGHIVGAYLYESSRKILYRLARSRDLWERRIAIVATFYFIRHNDFDNTLDIAKILLNDKHDLIHKAVGWMLREVGKRNQEVEENFLKEHYRQMPRTMLRYAIERFPQRKRQDYLKGRV